jgi:hypothetical protein
VIFFIAFSSAATVQSSIFGYGSEPVFTSAFSQNLLFSLGEKIFGSIKNMMIVLTTFGLLLHFLILYSLFQKNIKKSLKNHYLMYWAFLFLPYLLMLIFSIKV